MPGSAEGVKLHPRCQFLVECLDLPAATGVDSARWEMFQLDLLNSVDQFRIDLKSRQIAWSFTVAAGAVANAVLSSGNSTAFVSINKDEASEKIRYCRQVYENLQVAGLPKITKDNQNGLEFDNGRRLLSLPGRQPRGLAGFDIILDEFAHVQRDRAIYQAAVPITSKKGRILIGSSPMGAAGTFWEIYTQKMQKYPGFTRRRTPWWDTYSFSINPLLARQLAPTMQTFERVEMFGNDRIKAIFANMPLDSFQEEYECKFVDESASWITWAEIIKNQKLFTAGKLKYWTAGGPDDISDVIINVLQAIQDGQCEPTLVAGVDIGRKHDKTELVALGVTTTGALPYRFGITLDRVPFDEQKTVLMQLLTLLPFTRVLIDQNGIGAQLAEELQATGRAEGVSFTVQSKELWAVEARVQAQRGNTPLPPLRDLAYQIHSIKRSRTSAKNNVYDTSENEKHHADKFWAWCLAIWAQAQPGDGWIAYARNQLNQMRQPEATG